MSNVRLYNAEAEQSAPSRTTPNPQDVLSEAQETFSAPGTGPSSSITLRRSGERPFRFQGSELCSATGWTTNSSVWHEINLYRTHTDRIVADVRVFKKSPTEKDVFIVEDFESIDEAMTFLEQYDPQQDVVSDLALDDPSVPVAELALQGVVLRQRLEETSRQYQAILGDLLYELEKAH